MADETLEYRFEEKGLSDLRKDMKRLASDFEEVGDEAQDAGLNMMSGLEGAEESAEDLDRSLDKIDTSKATRSIGKLVAALEHVEDRLDRLDNRSIDVDTDVDRSFGGGGGGSSRGGRVRLPGELDEAAQVISQIPNKGLALIGALTAATAALVGAAGLAGAATALATRLGDTELRQDIGKLKQRFRKLGKTFVDEFEPLIRESIIPAGVALSESLRDSIPELKEFADNNMPDLVSAINGLIQAVIGTIKVFGYVSRSLGVLISTVQFIEEALGGQATFGGGDSSVRKEFIDILQGFGFGGESVGVGDFSFDVPQSELSSIAEKIRSGEKSISGNGSVPKTEDLRKVEKQIAILQQKFRELGTITRKEFLRQLVQLRRKGVTALQEVEQATGEQPKALDKWVRKLKQVQNQLDRLKSKKDFDKQVGDIQDRVQLANRTSTEQTPTAAPQSVGTGGIDMSGSVQQMNGALSMTELRLRSIQRRIKRVSVGLRKGLGRTLKGTFRQATSIVGDFATGLIDAQDAGKALERVMKRAISSIISQLVAATAKALVLKLIAAGISGGAGAALPTGTVPPGITGAEILGKTATTAGVKSAGLNINIQGQTTTSGRDLKTVYDTETRVQRRQGRRA